MRKIKGQQSKIAQKKLSFEYWIMTSRKAKLKKLDSETDKL